MTKLELPTIDTAGSATISALYEYVDYTGIGGEPKPIKIGVLIQRAGLDAADQYRVLIEIKFFGPKLAMGYNIPKCIQLDHDLLGQRMSATTSWGQTASSNDGELCRYRSDYYVSAESWDAAAAKAVERSGLAKFISRINKRAAMMRD